MSLELYGSFRSRTRRTLWAALEVDADFEHVPHKYNDPILKTEPFLKINPLGRIPALRDEHICLSESLALNLYIAKRYGDRTEPPIYPKGQESEARLWQWSFFAASDLDPWVVNFGDHTSWLPEEKRISAVATFAQASLNRSLQHLENSLVGKPFLVGEYFTIADLNVASVLQSLVPLSYPFEMYPSVDTWLRTSLDRPAAQAARKYP